MSKVDVSALHSIFRQAAKELSAKSSADRANIKQDSTKSDVSNVSLAEVVSTAFKRVNRSELTDEMELNLIVRAVLAWEFGAEILDDLSFADLSAGVVKHLKEDDILLSKIHKMLGQF